MVEGDRVANAAGLSLTGVELRGSAHADAMAKHLDAAGYPARTAG
jgi:hypothetical protein